MFEGMDGPVFDAEEEEEEVVVVEAVVMSTALQPSVRHPPSDHHAHHIIFEGAAALSAESPAPGSTTVLAVCVVFLPHASVVVYVMLSALTVPADPPSHFCVRTWKVTFIVRTPSAFAPAAVVATSRRRRRAAAADGQVAVSIASVPIDCRRLRRAAKSLAAEAVPLPLLPAGVIDTDTASVD
jgi:hypothetical protein